MKTPIWILLLAMAAPAPLLAQGRMGPKRRVGQEMNGHRDVLEQQIMHRFVDRSGNQLGLGSQERGRLEGVLRDSNQRRRDLTRKATDLRMDLVHALQDPETPDGRFLSILKDLEKLRDQEHRQWVDDQRALGEILTPRQRAQFVLMWSRFQESIRDVMARRPGTPPDTSVPLPRFRP